MATVFAEFRAVAPHAGECDGRAVAPLEKAAAAAIFVIVSPVVLAAGLTIRYLSGRPPLVAHRRVGRGGREFWMLKLRTMWGAESCSDAGGLVERLDDPRVPESKRERDSRVTSAFAAWCRKYSIDELPQLLHVVSGTMSLVGPRPLTATELRAHYGEAAAEVLSVRPGITGLWQVLGRNRRTYRQRLRLDLFFVRRRCAQLYALILLRTPGSVASGRNTS